MNKINRLNTYSHNNRHICSNMYILYKYIMDNYCIIRPNDDDDDDDNAEYYNNENQSLPNAYQIIDRY